MKPIIAIIIPPAIGHINCTFPLARQLTKDFEIVYIGHPTVAGHIIGRGWNVRPVMVGFKPKLGLKKFLSFIINIRKAKADTFQNLEDLFQTLKSLKPSLILIDAFLTSYYPILKLSEIPIILIQTYLDTEKSPGVPPLTSSYIPRFNILSNYYCEWLWFVRLARHRLMSVIEFVNFLGSSREVVSKHLISKKAMKFNRMRTFHYGIPDIIEIILSSKELDYPKKITSNKFHFGMSVDYTRTENFIEDFQKHIERTKSKFDRTLIYCSFGTIARQHNKKYISLIKKVCKVAESNPEWRFAISTSGLTNLQLKPLENVWYVPFAPQLYILQYCDLMITHGGINSIQECIHFHVPTLIYPLNKRWDQMGNAARVKYHNIGIIGNTFDSPNDMEGRLISVLKDQEIKRNLADINLRMKNLNERDEVIKLIQQKVSDI